MKTIITVKDMLEALSAFKEDDQIVIDLQTDITFDDDLYAFRLDAIPLSGLESASHELRLCPVQTNLHKGVFVEIRRTPNGYVVWKLKDDSQFVNYTFSRIMDAVLFAKKYEMHIARIM